MTAQLQPEPDSSVMQPGPDEPTLDERNLAQRGMSLLKRPFRMTAGRIRARSRHAAIDAARESTDERLVAPVFVLSETAAGSVQLRAMLRTHSQLLAPDVVLDEIRVSFLHAYVERAMQELKLDRDDLQFLLWDRMLHRELVHNGKHTVVLMIDAGADAATQYLTRCWPEARFVYLDAGGGNGEFGKHEHHDRLRIRYADLERDPEPELRRLCRHLGVRYEPVMLDLAAEGSQSSGG